MKHSYPVSGFAVALVLSVLAFGARAESTAGSVSGSIAQTDIQNVGSPNIAVNSYAPESTRVRYSGMPVASAGSTFVNSGSNDTCTEAGDALAVQTGPLAFNANKGGGMQLKCNDRADTRSMKETGEDAVAVTMRHCQNPEKASAYEDAAELRDAVRTREMEAASKAGDLERYKKAEASPSFRCPDRLRPQWALEKEGKTVPAQRTAASGGSRSADPFIAASGREYPSR